MLVGQLPHFRGQALRPAQRQQQQAPVLQGDAPTLQAIRRNARQQLQQVDGLAVDADVHLQAPALLALRHGADLPALAPGEVPGEGRRGTELEAPCFEQRPLAGQELLPSQRIHAPAPVGFGRESAEVGGQRFRPARLGYAIPLELDEFLAIAVAEGIVVPRAEHHAAVPARILEPEPQLRVQRLRRPIADQHRQRRCLETPHAETAWRRQAQAAPVPRLPCQRIHGLRRPRLQPGRGDRQRFIAQAVPQRRQAGAGRLVDDELARPRQRQHRPVGPPTEMAATAGVEGPLQPAIDRLRGLQAAGRLAGLAEKAALRGEQDLERRPAARQLAAALAQPCRRRIHQGRKNLAVARPQERRRRTQVRLLDDVRFAHSLHPFAAHLGQAQRQMQHRRLPLRLEHVAQTGAVVNGVRTLTQLGEEAHGKDRGESGRSAGKTVAAARQVSQKSGGPTPRLAPQSA